MDSVIEHPFPDTDSADWERVKRAYSKNIQGLSVIE